MNNHKKVFQLLFSQTKDFIFYTIFSILSALLVVFEVIVLKYYIDYVIESGHHENTSLYVGLFLVGITSLIGVVILKSRTKTILCSNVSMELTRESYDAVLYADINEFSKEDIHKKTLKILENSDDIANVFLRRNFLKFYETSIAVVIMFFAMLIIEPILSLFVLIGLPIYYVVDKGLEIIIQKTCEKNNNAIKKVNYIIETDFKNIKSIKLMNSAEFEKANLDEALEEYQKAKINKNIASNISTKALQVIFNAIIISIILGLSGFLSADTTYGITSGIVVSFVVLVPYTFINFSSMIHCSFKSTKVESQINELTDVCKIKTERKSETVDTLEEIKSIKFKGVSYTSENNEYIVNNITFDVKRGEKLGILSFEEETNDAIFDLITKLTKPRSGQILFNDCDINKVNTKYIRSIIASIFERDPIVNDSICENIIYPLDFDDYKYNDALYKSGLKDIVNKYSESDDTNIFSNEIEKEVLQRVLFANAFFKDSKIYLIKDWNGISPSLEAELLEEVLKLKNKIIITITSKAYQLNKYDKILVVKNGEVVEFGSYDELVNNKSSYFYKMVRKPSSSKIEKIS